MSPSKRISPIPLLLLLTAVLAAREEPTQLELLAPVEQKLSPGETHVFRVALEASQYVRIEINQRGLDFQARLFSPEGAEIASSANPPDEEEAPPLSVVANADGIYRLEISLRDPKAIPRSYRLQLSARRAPRDEDRERMRAETAYAEGNRLLHQNEKGSLRQSLQKYDEARLAWRELGDGKGEATATFRVGHANFRLGEYDTAFRWAQLSLELYQSVEHDEGVSNCLGLMANIHFNRGEFEKSIELHLEDLAMRRAAGDRLDEAIILNNLGINYLRLGEVRKALEYYNQALPLHRASGNRREEAQTLSNMGAAHRLLGSMQEALDCIQGALTLARAEGDRRRETFALSDLGAAYLSLGEYQDALEYFETALSIARTTGDRWEEAFALNELGRVSLRTGDIAKAIACQDRALIIRRSLGDHAGEADALYSRAEAYLEGRDGGHALEDGDQALAIFRAQQDRMGEGSALLALGRAHSIMGSSAKARDVLREAVELLDRAAAGGASVAEARYYLARAERTAGNLDEAILQIEASLQLTESVRSSVARYDLRSSYLGRTRDRYEFAIDLFAELERRRPDGGFASKALETSERAKARSLLELLGETKLEIRQDADADLVEQERSLHLRIQEKAYAQTRLLGRQPSSGQATSMGKEINALLEQYRNLEGEIRAHSPRCASLVHPSPLRSDEIQRALDKDTVLLEYALGDDHSYLWVVTPTSISLHQLARRVEIERLARRVYELWSTGSPAGDASRLSRALLLPLAEQLNGRRLVIVADGALQYVPFAALPTGPSGVLLGMAHEIIGLPSVSCISVLRPSVREPGATPRTVAVLADPVYDSVDPRVTAAGPTSVINDKLLRVGHDVGAHTFNRLLSTRREVDTIVAVAGKKATLTALDFDASREIVATDEFRQSQILHFAVHGILNEVHPELSGLVLSLVDRNGSPQNGFLQAHEIYNLKLNADLVVLSACQTALGKDVRGEGLVGLTRAFMYAGVPRVVASLWRVPDRATAELMKFFYQAMLVDGLAPPAALRTAQNAIRQNRRWSAPYYWAAFTLQGEWK